MPRDPPAPDIEIEHREKFSVRSRVGDQRPAFRIGHHHRLRNAVVGMAAENDVDPGDARSELEVDVHAVVREQHHDLRSPAADFVCEPLQALLLDAEFPLGDEPARMGDRRVGKRLADDADRHAGELANGVGFEHRIAEIAGLDVLREEFDLAGKIALHDLLHAGRAVGELPVPGHDVHAQQLLRLDHVLPSRPERNRRSLPGVAAVEEEARAASGAQPLHERRKVREAAQLSIRPCRPREVEMGEGVRFAASRPEVEMPQQCLADQMRRAVPRPADAEIDARLAEMDRKKLRMTIGEMQQRDVAEARQVVERRSLRRGARIQRESGRGGGSEGLQEFAAGERH